MQVCRAGNITCLKHAAAAAVRRIMLCSVAWCFGAVFVICYLMLGDVM